LGLHLARRKRRVDVAERRPTHTKNLLPAFAPWRPLRSKKQSPL
jgi:hypothetical protein